MKTVTHEEVDSEYLGGAPTHTTISGVAHLAAADEATAMDHVRRLLAFLPQNNLGEPPRVATQDPADRRDRELDASCPTTRRSRTTCTTSSGASSTTATSSRSSPAGRRTSSSASRASGGRSVGIVAQQPAVLAGALDIDASIKAARFVRTCDCFNVPLVTLVDVPGFLPGVGQEHGGIIKHGSEAALRLLRGDGPEGHGHHPQGVRRCLRRHEQQAHPRRHELRLADGRDRGHGSGGRGQHHLQGRDRDDRPIPAAEHRRLVAEYEAEFNNPYVAAARGYIDDVILPSDTRPRLIAALEMLADKRDTNPRKKHGNIPL